MHYVPLWTEDIREVRLLPAQSICIKSTSPITSLSDSHDGKGEAGKKGGINTGKITLLLEYAIISAATVSEHHHLNRGK